MRRFELQNLLPAGTVTDRSRSEVLHELTSVSAGAGAPSSDVGGSGGVGLSGSGAAANSLTGILQGSTKDVTEQISALTSQITTLSSTQQTHIGVTQDNTQAITQNTSAKSSGSSVGSTVGNLASSLLGGGLSLSPLITGLMSLFRRKRQPERDLASAFQIAGARSGRCRAHRWLAGSSSAGQLWRRWTA